MTLILIVLAFLGLAGQIASIVWAESRGLSDVVRTTFWTSTVVALAAGIGFVNEGLVGLSLVGA